MKKTKSLILIFILSLFFNSFLFSQDEQYQEALKHISELNRVKAYEILIDIIKKHPNFSEAHYQTGLINTYFNRDDEALANFNNVLSLNKAEVLNASFELSKLYIKKSEYNSALLLLNSVIEKDVSNDKALYERARIKNIMLDFNGASNDLTTAILYNPADYLYYYQRGLALIELRNFPGAIQDFDKVINNIKSTPELETGYFYRGYAYYQEGLDPKYRGHKGLFHKCLSDYNMCIALDKNDEAAYFNRGEANMALNNYINAISDYKHALLLNPKNYDALYNKAMCNYSLGEIESAVVDMKKLLVQNPNFTDAYFQLGVWSYESNQTKESIAYFTKLISLEEVHSDAYLFRGYAFLDENNMKSACQDWVVADKLGDKEAHKDIIKYCSSIGKK